MENKEKNKPRKIDVIRNFFYRVATGVKVGWWAFKNPKTLLTTNFKMLSDLLALIFKVAEEDRHRMTHIAYVHPEEGEQQIVSIWAGAGIGADPLKRIKELLDENAKLKIQIYKRVVSENIDDPNRFITQKETK